MSEARAEILARVSRALGEQRALRPLAMVAAGQRGEGDAAAFLARIREYGGVATKATELAEAIAEAVARQGVRRLAVPGDIPREWLPEEVEVVVDEGIGLETLTAVDGALTASACGIAATGTVVLDGGPGQGRRALTLVPDVHVCVVRRAQLVPDLPEALDLLAGSIAAGRALTFVSGPSATSDIEFVRVEGVHGPRRLEVVLQP